MTTYLTMLVGFSSALAVFIVEVCEKVLYEMQLITPFKTFQMIFRYVNSRKGIPEPSGEHGTRRIMVQPSRKGVAFGYDVKKTISPPPPYGDAIKTIFNTQNSITQPGKPGSIESYRTLNGRTYAVVRDETGTQLVPTRAPSAALFNYQLAYNSYN